MKSRDLFGFSNFVSERTRQYANADHGKRDSSYIVTDEKDPGFRDNGVQTNVVVHFDDPARKTQAFVNRRVEVDGAFASLAAIAADMKEFAEDLRKMTISDSSNISSALDQIAAIATETRNGMQIAQIHIRELLEQTKKLDQLVKRINVKE